MEKQNRLNDILDQLDIPEKRKSDMDWLLRNIFIRNEGPLVEEAISLIKDIKNGK